jgi:hypothetical protein
MKTNIDLDSIWNPKYLIEITPELIKKLINEYSGDNIENYIYFLNEMKQEKMLYNTKRKTFMSKPRNI